MRSTNDIAGALIWQSASYIAQSEQHRTMHSTRAGVCAPANCSLACAGQKLQGNPQHRSWWFESRKNAVWAVWRAQAEHQCGQHSTDLLERHAQDAAVQVRHIDLPFTQRVLQADAHAHDQVVAVALKTIVRDLSHHKHQVLRSSANQSIPSHASVSNQSLGMVQTPVSCAQRQPINIVTCSVSNHSLRMAQTPGPAQRQRIIVAHASVSDKVFGRDRA